MPGSGFNPENDSNAVKESNIECNLRWRSSLFFLFFIFYFFLILIKWFNLSIRIIYGNIGQFIAMLAVKQLLVSKVFNMEH